MTRRRSINVEGFDHGGQPIPAACRIGRVIMTGGVYGIDRQTRELSDDPAEQARLMFENLALILQTAGASVDDVIKVNVSVSTSAARAALNAEWVKSFPNADARPARQVLQNVDLPGNMVVQCDATAILDLGSQPA